MSDPKAADAVTALSECVLALAHLAIMTMDGPCWCQVAIGNPMCNEHSAACKRARAAIDQLALVGSEVLTDTGVRS